MSKNNGNRACPNCRHHLAAHGYEAGTDRRPCFAGAKREPEGVIVQRCPCVTVIKACGKCDAPALNIEFLDRPLCQYHYDALMCGDRREKAT